MGNEWCVCVCVYIYLKKPTKFRFNGRQKTRRSGKLSFRHLYFVTHLWNICLDWPRSSPHDTKTLPFSLYSLLFPLPQTWRNDYRSLTTSMISFHHEQRLVIAWISVSCGFRGRIVAARNRGTMDYKTVLLLQDHSWRPGFFHHVMSLIFVDLARLFEGFEGFWKFLNTDENKNYIITYFFYEFKVYSLKFSCCKSKIYPLELDKG